MTAVVFRKALEYFSGLPSPLECSAEGANDLLCVSVDECWICPFCLVMLRFTSC